MLFIDLVSFTALSESRDTEDVRELLSRYFDLCSTIVKRYGGAVEKYIGDAVMAVWGAPLAHEDDAERAVRAALEMVSSASALGDSLGLPELAVHAGVVTGEVAATTGLTDQGMVAGDPVNTAARIQGLAGAGEVWVDANTRALTAAAVTYDDAGGHPLKGKSDPVPLFRAGTVIAAVGGSQRVDGLEAPLAGRSRELQLLKELFHATEESGRPRLVVLDGEAGLGKSRLAWELEKYLDGFPARVMWHRGRCLSYGDGVVFWALAEAVRARLGLIDTDTADGFPDALSRTLEEYVEDPRERVWLQPRMSALLGASQSEFGRDDLFAAWTRFFERVGGGDPVVWVIDDGHHADSGLLDFLDVMLGSARKAIFVLILARPQLLARRPELGGRRANVIRLEPISDTSMAELVDGLVAGLRADARADLVKKAEGVPLYAVETVRALIDQDLVRAFEGKYVVVSRDAVDLSRVAAPTSLRALVAARLDALSPQERRLVADASILGMSFTRRELGFLPGPPDNLDDLLLSLQRKEIIVTETDRFSAEHGQYRFVQSVVRQVAHTTLSRRYRKALHIAVAEHLLKGSDSADDLSAVIAQHLIDALEASGRDDPDVPELERRVVQLLHKAGARASSLGSFSDAIRLFESALERAGLGDDPVALLHEAVADAALNLAQYDRALEHADAALESRSTAGDPVSCANAAALRAEALMGRGENRAAVDFLRPRYHNLILTHASREAKLQLGLILNSALNAVGDDSGRLEVQNTSLHLAEELDRPSALASAMMDLAFQQASHGSGRVADAVMRDLLSFATENELWRPLALVQVNLGIDRMHYSPQTAIDFYRASLATARGHGLAEAAELAYCNLAVALWTAGEWAQLEVMIREYLNASDDHNPGDLAVVAAVDQWRLDAGMSGLVDRAAVAFDADDLNIRSWDHHVRMLDAVREGRLDAAAQHASESVRFALEDAGFHDDFMHVWPRAVRTTLQADDLRRAADLVAQVEGAVMDTAKPVFLAHLPVLRGLLNAALGGEPDAIEADLRAGIAALENYGSPPYRAQAQEDLGRWLVSRGRPAEARESFDAARATYDDLGAIDWVHRIDSQFLTRTTAVPDH